jgi:hypothetical protein
LADVAAGAAFGVDPAGVAPVVAALLRRPLRG